MPAIVYKEFLPDQPELGLDGLVRAQNVLPKDSGYGPFLPLNTTLGAITQNTVVGAFAANGSTKGSSFVFAMANATYYEGSGGGSSFTTRGAASASSNYEKFAQFNDIIIGVGAGHIPMHKTIGSASNFTALAVTGTTLPAAGAVGVIGQFVVLGDFVGTAGTTQNSNYVQWSAIGQPTNWPLPNSATAIATQAGQQIMPLEHGPVYAIHGGDQRGVVLQHKAVSRMTYVQPPAVFQFDEIDTTQGLHFPYASVQVGRLVYFISAKGFCRTDGVTVENIGAGKVDSFFWSQVTNSNIINAAYDPVDDLVYFSWSTNSSTANTSLLIFSPRTNRWTYALQAMTFLVTPASAVGQIPRHVMGFNTGNPTVLGKFEATAGSAIFETGDLELTEGGRSYIDAIKPHVESSGTAPAMGVRIGIRNDLGTTPSYTTTASAFARTGFAHFRDKGVTDGKYARVELNITGAFERATGFEFDAKPSGGA